MIYAGWLDAQEKRIQVLLERRKMAYENGYDKIAFCECNTELVEIREELNERIINSVSTFTKSKDEWEDAVENVSLTVLMDIARMLSE